jgi:hypothetical protein
VNRPAEETTEYLLERIRAALAHDPRLGELELPVSIVDDRVVVTGTVQTPDRRQAISDLLAELVPDRRVENLTKVLDTTKRVDVQKGSESETVK